MNDNIDENEKKIYKRETLISIPPSKTKILNFQESKLLENKFGPEVLKGFSTVNLSHLYFYHYSCESVDDYGWGCAWRSMQSVLKYQLSVTNQNKDNEISFDNLFMKYGAKNKLNEIYKDMKKNKKISCALDDLENKTFAPHDLHDGWAEPFISQLVLHDFGFEGELILVNDYPKFFYAPKEVFEKPIELSEFKELLKSHFTQKNAGPIIMDDGYSSLSVIGVKFDEENSNMQLIIMDPHAVNKPEIGIYIVILNSTNGDFIELIPNNHVCASACVHFSNKKPWMIYVPNEKILNNNE